MSANSSDAIRERIASVCAASPFGFVPAVTPFGFDLQPTGSIEEVFRVESEAAGVIGGFNYLEDRTDAVTIWLARKQAADPQAVYTRLLVDASSLRAALVRDGATGGGDYSVPDSGAGMSLSHDTGREFAVLRLSLHVNFEAQL